MRYGKPYKQTSGRGSCNYGEQVKVLTESNGERYPIDVLRYKRDRSRFHPTQKPIALLEYLIRTYTDEGDVVLDNCMGSGSTGVAALSLLRGFIGIEKDPTYFDIAKKRLESVTIQQDLFKDEK